jgi:hypothetical protein
MLPLGMPHEEHVSSLMSNFNERMASRVRVCADLTVPLRK